MTNTNQCFSDGKILKYLMGWLLWCGLWGMPVSGRAITFNVNYDKSITSLTNATTVEAAFNLATQTLTNEFTNNLTIYIGVYWGNTGPFSSGVGLGSSIANQAITNSTYTFTYGQVTNALRLMRNSADDSNAVASLPASDPLANNKWWLPVAEARALRTYPATGTNSPYTMDGYVGFGSNYTYTFSATNRAVPGAYDFIGLAEHEITEVMGRESGLNLYGDGVYLPFDLFRFTNNAARSTNATDRGVYFSVNKGLTALKYFYTNYTLGDIQDWLSSTPPDSYDSFSVTGQQLDLTPADFTAMDILGYNAPMATNGFVAGWKKTNGTFQVSFTNTPGAPFSILYSTNVHLAMTNWLFLGYPTQSAAGHFLYIDTLYPNGGNRFYRIRSP